MANLWYTSVSTIWPYTNSIPPLSNFCPYLNATATAATATNTPIYAWQNIFFVYIIISWIKSNAPYISKFAKIATTDVAKSFLTFIFLIFSCEPRLYKRVCPSVGPSVRRLVMVLLGGQRRAGERLISCIQTCLHVYAYILHVHPSVRWLVRSSVSPLVMLLSAGRDEPANDELVFKE